MNKFLTTFRALKYRNFRLFFPGLIITQTGIWLQNVAVSWLVYEMTKSPFMMGVVMFLSSIPMLFLTPFAGVIVDKFSRHKLLILVQILFCIQTMLMSVLIYFDSLNLVAIVLLGVLLSFAVALDAPLRQSVFVYLVDDVNDLSNAISLNASCFNIGRLLGPALAGILIGKFGIKACFLFNFLFTIPMIFLVLMMKFKEEKSQIVKEESILDGLKNGFEYAFKTPQIAILLLYLGVFCFIGFMHPALIPIYTKDVLMKNADMLGYLMSAAGIGALVSSLILAAKTTIVGLRRILFLGVCLMGLCFILLGVCPTQIASLVALFGIGFGMTASLTPDNTLIQIIVDDDKRGRIMGFSSICFLGTTSISAFIAGALAQIMGVKLTFVILGILLIISAIFFGLKMKRLNFEPKS